MNTQRKKAAIKKYQPEFDKGADVVKALKADEKAYTDDEINEIVQEFGAGARISNAVAKFTPVAAGISREELIDKINEDEGDFTAEEADEIADAIEAAAKTGASSGSGASNSNKTSKAKKGEHYSEWKVEVTNVEGKKEPTYEKIRCIREVVKITDEEAETLNAGVLYGGNSTGSMYFKN